MFACAYLLYPRIVPRTYNLFKCHKNQLIRMLQISYFHTNLLGLAPIAPNFLLPAPDLETSSTRYWTNPWEKEVIGKCMKRGTTWRVHPCVPPCLEGMNLAGSARSGDRWRVWRRASERGPKENRSLGFPPPYWIRGTWERDNSGNPVPNSHRDRDRDRGF